MANEVNINKTTNTVNVTNEQTKVIRVTAQGPQGQKGDTGPTGPQGPQGISAFSGSAESSSISTRLSTAESELGNTLISSSAQIASDISGSFTSLSGSLSTRLTTDETNITNLQTDSASFSTRITTAESELGNTLISSSAQIASDISGSSNDLSSSLSTRLTTDETNITNLQTDSGSFSSRITTEETNVDNLQTDSGSFSTRITTAETELSNTLVSSSAQIASDISGSTTSLSSSLSTRLTTDETNITNLQTDSGSFSTRVTTAETELSNTLISSSAQIASDISGSFTQPSASISTRLTTAETELSNTLISSSAQIASDISGSFTGGTGVTITSGQITIGQDVGTTANVDFGSVTTTGNVNVGGNLDVSGTTTSIDSATLNIGDKNITIGSGSTTSAQLDGGGIDFGLGGTIANLHYRHSDTSITSSVDFRAPNFYGIFQGALSSSAQISSDISGSFTAASSSFSTRITTAETELDNTLFSGSSQVDHDLTTNFVSNEHIDHSTITLTAGDGLSGGGDITTNRSFAVDATVLRTNSGVISSSAQIASDISGSFTSGFEFTGTISGSSTSTGSFGYVIGDAGGLTNLPSAAITSYTNSGDNKIITSVDSVSVQGEDNLTFNGSVLNVTGDMTITGDVSGSSTSTGSFGHLIGGSSATINGFTFPTTDGTDGQTLTTDGSGVLTFDDVKVVQVVKNISGATLQKGTPVHAVGSVGNTPTVIAASASDATTMPATFVLDEQLVDDEEGRALLSGFINGVNTVGFIEGGIVYVGESGGYTQQKPTGTNLIQNLGIVTKVDANGSGYIYGSGRSNDVPNLLNDHIFFGSGSNQMQQIHISGAIDQSTLNNINLTGDISSSITSTASFGLFVGDGSGLENVSIETGSFASGSDVQGILDTYASGSDLHQILAESSSYVVESETGSFASGSDVQGILDTYASGSDLQIILAESASYLNNDTTSSFGAVSMNSTLFVQGDITTSGSVIAQQFRTEFVSESIIFASGSTRFGDSSDDKHRYTGSIEITGNISSSFTSTGSFGNLKLADFGGLPFASGSDVQGILDTYASGSDLQVILTESSSYVVESETGSFASGSDVQGILDDYAKGTEISGSFNQGFEFTGTISGSITSTASFGKIFGDGSDLENVADPAAISGSFQGGGSNSFSGSLISTASFGTLELVNSHGFVLSTETSSFASGSDLQIIQAESASYVVSTNTGSFASGSDIQVILAESASYLNNDTTSSLG